MKPHTFKPVALPELTRPNALIGASLEVDTPGHGPAMDGIDDAFLHSQNQLPPPFPAIHNEILLCCGTTSHIATSRDCLARLGRHSRRLGGCP